MDKGDFAMVFGWNISLMTPFYTDNYIIVIPTKKGIYWLLSNYIQQKQKYKTTG